MSNVIKVTDMNATIQSPSLSYMKQAKAWGSQFNFVKTSEGTGWPCTWNVINKIKAMIQNSMKTWGQFGVYHFWHGESANVFLGWSKFYNLDTPTTKFMLDVEDPSTQYNIMNRINSFFQQLIDHGYKPGNLFLYCPLSWVRDGIINPNRLKYGFMWVASYPYASLYVDNKTKPNDPYNPHYNVWQFSGMGNQDWSYAYNGCMDSSKPQKKSKPKIVPRKKVAQKKASVNHYLEHGSEFEVITDVIHGYKDQPMKQRNNWDLVKGSHLTGQIIKFNGYTRLNTAHGWFSTNTKYLKVVK